MTSISHQSGSRNGPNMYVLGSYMPRPRPINPERQSRKGWTSNMVHQLSRKQNRCVPRWYTLSQKVSVMSRGRRGKQPTMTNQQDIRVIEGGEWRLCLVKPVHSVPDENRDALASTMGQEDLENNESHSSKIKSVKITAHHHKPSSRCTCYPTSNTFENLPVDSTCLLPQHIYSLSKHGQDIGMRHQRCM